MFKGILCLLCLLIFIPVHGQNASDALSVNTKVKKRDTAIQMDLGDVFKTVIHKIPKPVTAEYGKKIYFTLLPLALNPPGGGNALITSTSAGFYLGNRKENNLSTANFAPYWNFGSQFGLPLRTELWFKKNQYLIQTDTRFLFYPQNTWGLGNGYSENNYYLVNYKYLRFYLNFLRQIKPYLYLGFGYNLDFHIQIMVKDTSLASLTSYPYGTETGTNSFSSGGTLNLLFDNRFSKNNIVPVDYFHFIFRNNTKLLGSQNNWSSIFFDFRKYISFAKKTSENRMLAFRTFLWSSLGKTTPYLDLPSIGWDLYERSGRGIEQNRYRGKTLIYFESEYRSDITRNGLLGFVVFGNVNSATDPAVGQFQTFHPAIGAGLRIKISKVTKTNLAIDYAISKSHNGLWLALGEDF